MKSIISVFCFFFCANVFAQSTIVKDKLFLLRNMIGTWESKNVERNSDGDYFKENGTLSVRWMLDSTWILIEEKLELVEAIGAYKNHPKNRSFNRIISFNTTKNLYETYVILKNQSELNKGWMIFDARDSSLNYDAMFYIGKKKDSMRTNNKWVIGGNTMTLIDKAYSLNSDYLETYTAEYQRVMR